MAQDFTPLITETRSLKIADREITIEFATVPSFGQGFQGRLPLFSLFGGVLISFVGFAFIFSIVTARGRALDLAERMTRSQRRIVESSQDIIAVMDIQGAWKSLSRQLRKRSTILRMNYYPKTFKIPSYYLMIKIV